MLRFIVILLSILAVSAQLRGPASQQRNATDADASRNGISVAESKTKPDCDPLLPCEDESSAARTGLEIVVARLDITHRAISTRYRVSFSIGGADYAFEGTSFDSQVQSLSNGQGIMLIYDLDQLEDTSSFSAEFGGGVVLVTFGLHGLVQIGTGSAAVGTQNGQGTWSS